MNLLFILILLFIFYLDLRYRAIYWFIFPLLLVLILTMVIQQKPVDLLFLDAAANFVFLLLQIFILTVYFSIKEQKWVNITKGLLNWGDLLFLLCIAFYMNPSQYVLFYVLSLILSLLLSLGILIFKKSFVAKIPLAGFQALFLAVVVIFKEVWAATAIEGFQKWLFLIWRR